MDNKKIVSSLKLLAQLSELHNENPFKTKSIANAAFKLGKYAESLATKSLEELSSIEGVGKSVAQKIQELIQSSKMQELEDLIEKTPEGIIEMLKIKGLGPKKVEIIWKQLEIESIGELYYACNENRLIEAKGFGLKTQEDIKKLIEFTMSNKGVMLLSNALLLKEEIETNILSKLNGKFECVGELRRQCEVVSKLTFLVDSEIFNKLHSHLESSNLVIEEENQEYIHCRNEHNNSVLFVLTSLKQWAVEAFIHNADENHLHSIPNFNSESLKEKHFENDEEIYASFNMSCIPLPMRESDAFIKQALEHSLPNIIEYSDLKGSLHNHSTYSDGIHTLKEMSDYCKELGYQYLGICDHSKSAFYAGGLSIERVMAQHKEIDQLNASYQNFQILKGIESDILNDGSLDYPDEVLKTFDFIVASVHSNLKMSKEKANERLIKAIENPYTDILGHPTGRLLLAREGYPIDHKLIIDACASNKVAIEINANPLRLDLDWRWIRYAIEKGVMLSINPDAHRKEGYHDMRFGVMVAQKAGMTKESCLNCLDFTALKKHFQLKRGL